MKPNTSCFTFTPALRRTCVRRPRAGHAHMLLMRCGASRAASPAPGPPRHVTNTLPNASASMRRRANSGDQPLAAAMCARASAGAPLAPGSACAGSSSGAGCAAATAALPRGRRGCQGSSAPLRPCWLVARCWHAAPAPAHAWQKLLQHFDLVARQAAGRTASAPPCTACLRQRRRRPAAGPAPRRRRWPARRPAPGARRRRACSPPARPGGRSRRARARPGAG
jgi:hypothetical protein